jgi:hypothetical protein
MLRYDKFMEAQFWVSEYGSAADPEQFKWLYAYSPYQHVRLGTKYPAVLFMTGDGDTRVAPLHARKVAALLQASTGSNRPVLLRYDMTAGHSGGRSVTQDIEDSTDMLSFLFWQIGGGKSERTTRSLPGAVAVWLQMSSVPTAIRKRLPASVELEGAVESAVDWMKAKDPRRGEIEPVTE